MENEQDFLDYLQKQDLALATQKYYVYNVERFLAWFKEDILNCKTKDVLAYLDYLQNTLNQQNITRRNHLIALRHYFDFLGQKEVTAFIKIQGTKNQRLNYVFSNDELTQLYDDFYFKKIANQPQNIVHERNLCMLGFLVYQGLKVEELDALFLENINLKKAIVRIEPIGKRGNARTLPLQASQIGNLLQYIEQIRPQFSNHQSTEKLFLPLPEQIFRGSKDNLSIKIALRYLNKELKTLHKDYLKINQLRTSVIVQWLKIQGLRKTQYLAGHKSIVSTEEYLVNNLDTLTENLDKYNPY
jgi:site-specific recombinase XerD